MAQWEGIQPMHPYPLEAVTGLFFLVNNMDRPKILLLGNGPHNRMLAEILAKADFCDVEQRVLNDMVITGRGFSRITIDDVCIRTEHVPAISIYNDYFKQIPADHPERKREPKGPRGKWGKLK